MGRYSSYFLLRFISEQMWLFCISVKTACSPFSFYTRQERIISLPRFSNRKNKNRIIGADWKMWFCLMYTRPYYSFAERRAGRARRIRLSCISLSDFIISSRLVVWGTLYLRPNIAWFGLRSWNIYFEKRRHNPKLIISVSTYAL